MKQTQNEIWKQIPNYEGLYDVSNLGRVRSYQNFGFALKDNPKMMKQTKNKYGYVGLTLCKKGKREQVEVHRIVARAFLPHSGCGMQIDHINGVKTDNRVENLEWVTPKENTLRSVANGLKPTGERHWKSKLTQKQVKEIRTLYKTGKYSHRKLGAMFGVTHVNIGQIVRNETWKSNESNRLGGEQ
jgi:hypothetical protein